MKKNVLSNKIHVFAMILLLLLLLSVSTRSGLAQTSSGRMSLVGRFTVVWGDGPSDQPPQIAYLLTTEHEQVYRLKIDEAVLAHAGGALRLNRQRVRAEVSALPLPSDSRGPAVYQVLSLAPELTAPGALAPGVSPAVSGSQPWVSILCKFSDVPAEPKSLAYFQNMYGSTYPGLDHYWRELSYNLSNVYGSVAVGWYTLPQPRSYYVYGGRLDFDRAAQDCTGAAEASIYFPNYVGINLMFNAELDGYAWGGAQCMTLDGIFRCWSMTWLPPWGYEDITVISHEMGHGFGLPHSSGAYGRTYDNVWDVMSDTWTYCSRSTHPIYGCLGQQTIAYHKDLLGWIPPEKKYVVPYSSSPSEQNPVGTFLMAQVPVLNSSTNFYTVEVRNWTGYDIKLPAQAVIIHEVQTIRENSAHVVDADGNGNTGDAGAMWTVGETFQDVSHSISVTVLASSGNTYQVRISNGSQVATLWLEPLGQLASVFGDVITFHWAQDWIERLYNAGITGGCAVNPLRYCPENSVTRAQMAVFLLKAKNGSSYTPPNVSPTFSDTAGHWAEDWIEALKAAGITSGYPDGTYRPEDPVTRAQMAVFLLKAKNGSSYTPPNVSPTFSDTAGHWAEDWIEALKAAGITGGYPDGTYRPDNSVTRAEMAVFLVKAFNLP